MCIYKDTQTLYNTIHCNITLVKFRGIKKILLKYNYTLYSSLLIVFLIAGKSNKLVCNHSF